MDESFLLPVQLDERFIVGTNVEPAIQRILAFYFEMLSSYDAPALVFSFGF